MNMTRRQLSTGAKVIYGATLKVYQAVLAAERQLAMAGTRGADLPGKSRGGAASIANLLGGVAPHCRKTIVSHPRPAPASANVAHGLRRTNADKRHAVGMLLADDEWRGWSDREIAQRCGVSHVFVGGVRLSLVTITSEDFPRTYTTRHGTTATMKTDNIGKSAAAEEKRVPRDERIEQVADLAEQGFRASQIAVSLGITEECPA